VDIELDYDVVGTLEMVQQVIQVVDYTGPFCCSSWVKDSEGGIWQPGTSYSIRSSYYWVYVSASMVIHSFSLTMAGSIEESGK
jgi:hypothetical protein